MKKSTNIIIDVIIITVFCIESYFLGWNFIPTSTLQAIILSCLVLFHFVRTYFVYENWVSHIVWSLLVLSSYYLFSKNPDTFFIFLFFGVFYSFLDKTKKPISLKYHYPKNGERITFISSNAYHKSTAYKGWTGTVEEFSLEDGFILRKDDGGSLVCGLSSRKRNLVTWCYPDDKTCTHYTSLFIDKK